MATQRHDEETRTWSVGRAVVVVGGSFSAVLPELDKVVRIQENWALV